MNRQILTAFSAVAVLGAWGCGAPVVPKDDFPTQPVTIVVTSNPGGGADVFAKAVAAAEVGVLAQPVQVENAAGESGLKAAGVVLERAADGYTLLFGNPGSVVTTPIIQKKPERKWSSFDPVARVHAEYEFIFVKTSSPWNTIDELIAAAAAAPDTIKVAGSNKGGTDNFVSLLLNKAANVKMVYDAYDGGGTAKTSFLAGNEDVLIGNFSEVVDKVRDGTIKPLAVASEARTTIADVPTLKEKGWNVVLFQWRGIFAPKGTPANRIQLLADSIQEAMKSESWGTYRANSQSVDLFLGPTEFRTFCESEEQRLAPLIAELGL